MNKVAGYPVSDHTDLVSGCQISRISGRPDTRTAGCLEISGSGASLVGTGTLYIKLTLFRQTSLHCQQSYRTH